MATQEARELRGSPRRRGGRRPTCVRLLEELVRAGEQLVVIAHGPTGQEAVEDLSALGATVLTTSAVRIADLQRAQVTLAKAVVILGDDDVFAVRVALAIEELVPDIRFVIEMSNPNIGRKLTQLLGDCSLLSSASWSKTRATTRTSGLEHSRS